MRAVAARRPLLFRGRAAPVRWQGGALYQAVGDHNTQRGERGTPSGGRGRTKFPVGVRPVVWLSAIELKGARSRQTVPASGDPRRRQPSET